MTENEIVRNCAPTLAGIKTGNMFTCAYESRDALMDTIRHLNGRLGGKGLRILPLRLSENKALIYLYRPSKLRRDLTQLSAAQLLQCRGYNPEKCEHCVGHLARKLRQQSDFPHEIGLFLGYPAEDVKGFIENRACNCKCSGCWKVYGNEEAALKKFAQYKKCTRIYCDQWKRGKGIEKLTVSG